MAVIEQLEAQVLMLVERCRQLQQENAALKRAQFEIEHAYTHLEQRSHQASGKLRGLIDSLTNQQK